MGNEMEQGPPVSAPIIIAAVPRSGSSMTAGVFAHHGIWTGTCRGPNAANQKGYFENVHIRRVMMDWHKSFASNGLLAMKRPGFRDAIQQAILNDGYETGQWLWKGSALSWPAFFEFTPKWVVCVRPSEKIFASCRRTNIFGKHLSDRELEENIERHQQQINYLVACRQAVRVFTAEVADGDYSSIAKALQCCGVTPDYNIIDDFVDPALWNRA
jgi:hypothetical protein